VKPFLESVATHPRFIPEIARRLSDPLFTTGLKINAYQLRQFVEKCEGHLQDILLGLDNHSKAALALIYMRNDWLESPIIIRGSEELVLDKLGSNHGGCVTALEALDGSLVFHSYIDCEFIWRFKHPTIGDAFAILLVNNPELLDIYIQGSSPSELIKQITCGDVGIENAVIVPRSLFALVLKKLHDLSMQPKQKTIWLSLWNIHDSLNSFLAYRCSKEFLLFYIESNRSILDSVSDPGLFLNSVSEVPLAERLHEFGLLPEENRIKFITTVSNYAINGEDLYALSNNRIKNVFLSHEYESLLHRVQTELLPDLSMVRINWEQNFQQDEPPEGYIQPLFDIFDILMEHFGDDLNVSCLIRREIELTDQWIAEQDYEISDKHQRTLGAVDVPNETYGIRSIFDDIDC